MSRYLLVIGAQRCGTTYLRGLLEDHPDIAMARPVRPEPKVFLDADESARGVEWYRTTFFGHQPDASVLGEKSTSYLDHPEAGVRAQATLGDPLVLVQLRDPVERAVSHWSFSTGHGLETRPLVEALEANLAGPQPWDPTVTSVSPFAYLERGHYARQLEPWLARFGADMRVQFLEELDAGTVAALYAWLGVDPGHRPTMLGRRVNETPVPPPPLPAPLVARLRRHFAESDLSLARLVGRPLPWSSPEVR